KHTALHFFFQAEDGIRDFHVTGVQTCALPISSARVVPAPTSTTSHRLRSTRKIRRSASPPRSPETPRRSWTAPSTDDTKFVRIHGRPVCGYGYRSARSRGVVMATTVDGGGDARRDRRHTTAGAGTPALAPAVEIDQTSANIASIGTRSTAPTAYRASTTSATSSAQPRGSATATAPASRASSLTRSGSTPGARNNMPT